MNCRRCSGVSGTAREGVVSEAFKTLLKDWGKSRDLIFVPQYEYQTLRKMRVYPDGAVLHALRVPLGYWEAKDEEDDLDKEIEKKFRKGFASRASPVHTAMRNCTGDPSSSAIRC